MTRHRGRYVGIALILAAMGGGWLDTSPARGQSGDRQRVSVFTADNESGAAQTISVNGGPVVDEANPFFLDLGINGRRCVTCHQPGENMTVSAAGLQARFRATRGTDPIFRTNDGSNSPLADVSTTDARRAAYSMLLRKGVIRVGLSIPTTAEFELVAVRDPYGYAGHNANNNELSLFRRPLPTTNLGFLSTVMWDGRETLQRGSAAAIHFDLDDQANDATQGHAQAPSPLDQAHAGRDLRLRDGVLHRPDLRHAGRPSLHQRRRGGPDSLSAQPFVLAPTIRSAATPNGANCDPAIGALRPDRLHRIRRVGEPERPTAIKRRAGRRAGPGAVQHVAHRDQQRGRHQRRFRRCPSSGPARPATTRLTRATTRCRRRSTSASPTRQPAMAPNAFGLPVGDMPVYMLRNKTTGEIKT